MVSLRAKRLRGSANPSRPDDRLLDRETAWSGRGNLGIHRHYGSVLALTLHGAWRYAEHDWVSRTGDIVHETPGSVHTLMLKDDSEVIFFVEGALEYIDSEGRTLAHEDWRSITQKHVQFCKERGIEAVDVARPRSASRDHVAAA